jgi:hypothetical protein
MSRVENTLACIILLNTLASYMLLNTLACLVLLNSSVRLGEQLKLGPRCSATHFVVS